MADDDGDGSGADDDYDSEDDEDFAAGESGGDDEDGAEEDDSDDDARRPRKRAWVVGDVARVGRTRTCRQAGLVVGGGGQQSSVRASRKCRPACSHPPFRLATILVRAHMQAGRPRPPPQRSSGWTRARRRTC